MRDCPSEVLKSGKCPDEDSTTLVVNPELSAARKRYVALRVALEPGKAMTLASILLPKSHVSCRSALELGVRVTEERDVSRKFDKENGPDGGVKLAVGVVDDPMPSKRAIMRRLVVMAII